MITTIRELEPAEIDAVSGGDGSPPNPGTGVWDSWWWPWVDVSGGGKNPPTLGG